MKCAGLLGYLLGHKFQPRYSTGSPTIYPKEIGLFSPQITAMAELLESSKVKTYEGDVCERCGKKLEEE